MTAVGVTASTPAFAGFIGPEEWKGLSESERHYYVMGLIDGIYFTTALEEDSPLKAGSSCLIERNLDSMQVLSLMQVEYDLAENVNMPPQAVLLMAIDRFCKN
jgi:hypothetical protein